ncbi:MAG: 3-oxoacyl-[acyl-carrier-protein] reductase [Chloroflexota bacterium]|nr:3-oxoacyl-[acyl-carrier-protein] reductase [Chloroflexota bacterium]
MNELMGQVALVTGASRGIGAVIARSLGEAGANVGVNFSSDRSGANEVSEEIKAGGSESIIIQGDVSIETEAELIVKQTTEEWGHIDILVNNAGITKDGLLLRMKAEDWDRVIDVDLRGAFLCSKYVMPHMIRRRQGRIINISSVVGIGGNAGQSNYAAAKAGLIGFTKAVAREVATRNVTVNAIAPGFIETGGMVEGMTDEAKQNVLDRIPMGRFGSGLDVAKTVVFLSGSGASYITGQVITIDGGLIA